MATSNDVKENVDYDVNYDVDDDVYCDVGWRPFVATFLVASISTSDGDIS